MDHFVTLDRLPDGFTFPPELSDRFRYDVDRHRLSYQGFMSKADFDRLSRLHDDWAFRRSLEDLFRICTLEPEPRPAGRLANAIARLIPGRDRPTS